MGETLIDKLTKTPEGRRLYQQERTIQELTDLICQSMQDQGMSIADLCCKLKYRIGSDMLELMLDGGSSMDVREMSDILHALGKSLHYSVRPLET